MSKKLAELLLKDRIITPAQFQESESAAQNGKDHVRHLIERGIVAEPKLLYYLSKKFGLPSINLDKFEINPHVLKMVSPDLVKRTRAIPIQANKDTLVVAICDPTAISGIEDIKFNLKMNVEPLLTSYSSFERILQKHYGGGAFLDAAFESIKKEAGQAKKTTGADDNGIQVELVEVHDMDEATSAQDGPVITLVNGILSECVRLGASDIHVEPYERSFRVRMRLDGTLREVTQIPKEMRRSVVARIKIMSRMDIAESRIPQDGRIKLRLGGSDVDFRVNTIPTLFGEKVVLRMLNQSAQTLDLKRLGFEPDQLKAFRKGIAAASGMVLVTGPTGSGKTTTLYSALTELNQITDNVSTVEDPVEYNLAGINQTQVHKDIGLTFASVLRALLRQDPDVILIGEIRDYETAEVGIQAALTGHLVLSTLHTNDAPSTIIRLMNMGVEPFLVTASVNTIVAQRLLRKICSDCKREAETPADQLQTHGLQKTYRGGGCVKCGQTGYRGRVAIYEIMDFSTKLKEAVLRGVTAIELKQMAIQEGMRSLRMAALAKVQDGTVSLEEALSMTMET